ncbi:MAG TPA: hypothetical protein PKZ36_00975 [Candidatus Paceibacterota bacterium]|nr:hypothetical protein [Candidatus Paceibacterota bacterium]HPT17964.1 hypothetical protein [Candidatus Paceibacterota bacterium]
MQNKFKKTPLIISVLFLLISCGIFYFIFYEIRNNVEVTQQSEIDLQKEIIKRNEVRILNNYFNSIQTEKALFETHFVQSSNVVPFLNNIEYLAKSVEVKTEVSSISINETDNSLVLEIKSSGDFENIYRFITLLENSSYELEFISSDIYSDIDKNTVKSKDNTDKWEALFKIKLVSFI